MSAVEILASGILIPDWLAWRIHSAQLINAINNLITLSHQASRHERPVFGASLYSRSRPIPSIGRGDQCGNVTAFAIRWHKWANSNSQP